MVASPNTPIATYMTTPTCRRNGQRAIANEQTSAPAAGAARIKPSPTVPTWKMSRAKIGRRAVAPPKITANMSSDMAPSTIGLRRTKLIPANSASNDSGARADWVRLMGMHQTRMVEARNSKAHAA